MVAALVPPVSAGRAERQLIPPPAFSILPFRSRLLIPDKVGQVGQVRQSPILRALLAGSPVAAA